MSSPESHTGRPDPVEATSIRTLREAFRVFVSRRGPRAIIKQVVASWGVRALLGPPSITEIPVVASVVAWWPVQEWLAHKYLLHLEPRTIAGQRIDPGFARVHRAHHRNPDDVDLTLLPLAVVRSAVPASIAFWLVAGLGSPRRTATGVATYATMSLVYEWTHFLVHTGYRPRSRFFRRVRRNHRLHHFHNEDYWLSFTWPGVDRWLGTEPDPRAVSHSETARRLHDLDD